MKPTIAIHASRPRDAGIRRRAAEGFTLIELMIVVAIVGILAAIVIPQYQIYTGRAQLAEAIHVTEGRRTAIAEQIQFGAPLSSINGGANGIPADVASDAGRFVDRLVIASGAIVATMKSINVSPCVLGQTFTLTPVAPPTPESPITWICTTGATCRPATCG